MNFLAPILLLGLLLVPVLVGLYLLVQRRRTRYAVRFTNLDLLANLAPKRPSWRRHVPAALYLVAIAFLVIGLARPTMVLAVPREDSTVILAIDISGSMKATDVAPTRLDAAKAAAHSFVKQLPAGIRVGIVSFASQPETLVEPTADHGKLDQAIDTLQPRDGTAMGDALMQVLDIAESIKAEDGTGSTGTATPAPSAAPGASGGVRMPPRPRLRRRAAPPRTDRPVSRSSRRSCCPTAPTRSARRTRSTRRTARPALACRSTRSPSGPRAARCRSATTTASS